MSKIFYHNAKNIYKDSKNVKYLIKIPKIAKIFFIQEEQCYYSK